MDPTPETETLADKISRGTVSKPQTRFPSVNEATPRIAVLPFNEFGKALIPEHLSQGLVADVIAQLSGLSELKVISHGSTLDIQPHQANMSEIARQLDARYLLRGTVRKAGTQIRLTTELVEAESSCVIGTHTIDVQETFSFEDQDRIVSNIVSTLTPRVEDRELVRIRGKRPSQLTVYEKVLLARANMNAMDRSGFIEAKSLLDDAIDDEPNYAEAYALAADWYSLMVGQGWSNDRSVDVAAVETYARKALQLDRNNVRALVFYGHRRSLLHRDYDTAKRSFRRALATAPNSSEALRWSSLTYSYLGETEEAVSRAAQALALSPQDRQAHSFYMALCIAHYTDGNFDDAADFGLQALADPACLLSTGGWVAASLVGADRKSEAKSVAHNTMARMPDRRVSDVVQHHPYRDPERRKRYGEHLLAAGFPE